MALADAAPMQAGAGTAQQYIYMRGRGHRTSYRDARWPGAGAGRVHADAVVDGSSSDVSRSSMQHRAAACRYVPSPAAAVQAAGGDRTRQGEGRGGWGGWRGRAARVVALHQTSRRRLISDRTCGIEKIKLL